MRKILVRTRETQPSRRYLGYVRVEIGEYRRALVSLLRNEAVDLIEMFDLHETMKCLDDRLSPGSDQSVVEKLSRRILQEAGARSPFSLSAEEFNGAAERFYRGTLRRRHLEEGFDFLVDDLRRRESHGARDIESSGVMEPWIGPGGALQFLSRAKREVIEGEASLNTIIPLIRLTLSTILWDIKSSVRPRREQVIA
jgi:hypothetical protein